MNDRSGEGRMAERRAPHGEEVARIVAAVRAREAGGGPSFIDTRGVSHFVPIPGDPRRRAARVDVGRLDRVLALDRDALACTAEPAVTFADLVRTTLRFGLLPRVVPELEGITLGSAVAGCSVESTSHRFGGFHDGCLEYEMGIKTLISRNHYTRERFWQIYDRPNYEACKQRLDPRGVFAGLYEKVHSRSR